MGSACWAKETLTDHSKVSAPQRGEALSVWQDTGEQSQENDNLITVSR